MVTNHQRTGSNTTIGSQNNHGVYLLPSGYSDQRSVSQWASDPRLNQTPPCGRMRTFTVSLWNQRVCYSVLSRPHLPSLGPVQEQSSQSFLRWKNGYSCESTDSTVLPGFKPRLFHKPPVWLPANMLYFSHAQDGDDGYGYLGGLGVCGGRWGVGTGVRELNETVHQNSQCSKRIHSLWKTG